MEGLQACEMARQRPGLHWIGAGAGAPFNDQPPSEANGKGVGKHTQALHGPYTLRGIIQVVVYIQDQFERCSDRSAAGPATANVNAPSVDERLDSPRQASQERKHLSTLGGGLYEEKGSS